MAPQTLRKTSTRVPSTTPNHRVRKPRKRRTCGITTSRSTNTTSDALIITQRNQKSSPFFRLPPELRNKVYSYLGDNIVHFGWNAEGMRNTPKFVTYPVCRQIFAETRLLPIADNTLDFFSPERCVDLINKFDPEQKEAVRYLRFDNRAKNKMGEPTRTQLRHAMRTLSALRKITICHAPSGLECEKAKAERSLRAALMKPDLEIVWEVNALLS